MHDILATSTPYRTLVEQADVGLVLLDADRCVRYVNAWMVHWLDLAVTDLAGRAFDALQQPDDRGRDLDALRSLSAGVIEQHRADVRLRGREGQFRWARVTYRNARDARDVQPDHMAFAVQVEDIGERRALQHDLGERRKELAAVHTLSQQLIDAHDTGEVAWMQRVVDIVPPAFRQPAFTESALQLGSLAAVTSGYHERAGPSTPRLRVTWSNGLGEDCSLEAAYTGPMTADAPFLEEELPLIQTIAALVRVAMSGVYAARERQHAQAALQFSETRLDLALDAVQMGVVEWDLVQQVAYLSETARELYGYPADRLSVTRAELREHIHPDDLLRVRHHFDRDREVGKATNQEFRVVLPNGRVRWVSVYGRFFRGPSGTWERRLGVVVDITQRKQLEAQFLHAQKMEAMGQLAAGVAHDFNNLLTIIDAAAEFILATAAPDSETKTDATDIRGAVSRGISLTRQLLTFSRKQEVRATRVDLNQIVRDAKQLLVRLIDAKVVLTMNLANDAMPLFADPHQLEQVIMNLVVNARDAMPNGGQLTIRTRRLDSSPASDQAASALDMPCACLDVQDTGAGMDQATQSRIFEPFFTTKSVGHGTGLGLATVFGIVTQLGGRVHVQSAVHAGSTFSIVLPIDSATVAPDVTG